jgi:hypothetical protein
MRIEVAPLAPVLPQRLAVVREPGFSMFDDADSYSCPASEPAAQMVTANLFSEQAARLRG